MRSLSRKTCRVGRVKRVPPLQRVLWWDSRRSAHPTKKYHARTRRQHRPRSHSPPGAADFEPDPLWAAALAELGGADCITLHLREDRRHIQDRDLRILRETVTVKLNLEMACDPGVLKIACEVKPDQVTLVPEKREEITTEGGLDIAGQRQRTADIARQLADAGISVSLFLDPDPRQLDLAAALNADAVEMHTGQYALPNAAWRRRPNWKNS